MKQLIVILCSLIVLLGCAPATASRAEGPPPIIEVAVYYNAEAAAKVDGIETLIRQAEATLNVTASGRFTARFVSIEEIEYKYAGSRTMFNNLRNLERCKVKPVCLRNSTADVVILVLEQAGSLVKDHGMARENILLNAGHGNIVVGVDHLDNHVIDHELGHVMGLGHNQDQNSIMYQYINDAATYTEVELIRLGRAAWTVSSWR
jgi:hypothetical protein